MTVTIKETAKCPGCGEWLVEMFNPHNYYCYNTQCKNYSREMTEEDVKPKKHSKTA